MRHLCIDPTHTRFAVAPSVGGGREGKKNHDGVVAQVIVEFSPDSPDPIKVHRLGKHDTAEHIT